ncbi:hypothetical protein KM295_07420 [Natronomonas sp. F2-12]|jgi:hypothetical protein|uniref:Uncharacterized protein n=1 Tax=Natronomonas aquatica TaxID=2841590 RepID=A0A9R1CQN7_9EURY|nr:hypothetical protein [Natronomonas aquatica]MCQ4333308.1 hypothetical protein [Natronomonas aquatica]
MGEPLAEKIDEMLASVQEQVDDPDLSFKLRTARQLLVVYDERLRKHREALDETDLEEETLENLRQLGYIDG